MQAFKRQAVPVMASAGLIPTVMKKPGKSWEVIENGEGTKIPKVVDTDQEVFRNMKYCISLLGICTPQPYQKWYLSGIKWKNG